MPMIPFVLTVVRHINGKGFTDGLIVKTVFSPYSLIDIQSLLILLDTHGISKVIESADTCCATGNRSG
jgi:hypothetical protein